MARELTPEEKIAAYEKLQERQRTQYKRQAARTSLFVKKAKEAGIIVTDSEIDDYLKK